MLGSMLGSLYRKLMGKLFGVEALVQESVARELEARVPGLMRAEIAALLRGGGGPRLMLDVEKVANILASVSSAQYFLQHMLLAENLIDREALIRFAMERCSVEGLVMEFGVYAGKSLRVIAGCTPEPVYGFDSFQGLPEDWTRHQKKGALRPGRKIPEVRGTQCQAGAGVVPRDIASLSFKVPRARAIPPHGLRPVQLGGDRICPRRTANRVRDSDPV